MGNSEWAGLARRYAVRPVQALQGDGGWLRSRHGVLYRPLVGLSSVDSFSRLQAP